MHMPHMQLISVHSGLLSVSIETIHYVQDGSCRKGGGVGWMRMDRSMEEGREGGIHICTVQEHTNTDTHATPSTKERKREKNQR